MVYRGQVGTRHGDATSAAPQKRRPGIFLDHRRDARDDLVHALATCQSHTRSPIRITLIASNRALPFIKSVHDPSNSKATVLQAKIKTHCHISHILLPKLDSSVEHDDPARSMESYICLVLPMSLCPDTRSCSLGSSRMATVKTTDSSGTCRLLDPMHRLTWEELVSPSRCHRSLICSRSDYV